MELNKMITLNLISCWCRFFTSVCIVFAGQH